MKRHVVLGVAVVAVGAALYYFATRPLDVRIALPISAVLRMSEYYEDSGFLPDYVHCISVKLDERDYEKFVQSMGLHAGTLLNAYPQTCGVGWWNPPSLETRTVFEGRGTNQEMGQLAVYKEGTLYFIGWNS